MQLSPIINIRIEVHVQCTCTLYMFLFSIGNKVQWVMCQSYEALPVNLEKHYALIFFHMTQCILFSYEKKKTNMFFVFSLKTRTIACFFFQEIHM